MITTVVQIQKGPHSMKAVVLFQMIYNYPTSVLLPWWLDRKWCGTIRIWYLQVGRGKEGSKRQTWRRCSLLCACCLLKILCQNVNICFSFQYVKKIFLNMIVLRGKWTGVEMNVRHIFNVMFSRKCKMVKF